MYLTNKPISHTFDTFVTRNRSIIQSGWPSILHLVCHPSQSMKYERHSLSRNYGVVKGTRTAHVIAKQASVVVCQQKLNRCVIHENDNALKSWWSLDHVYNTENWELSWCRLCRHWGHRMLSEWQPTMPPVTTKLASWSTVFRGTPHQMFAQYSLVTNDSVLSIIIYCGIYSIRVNLLSKCHVNWHFTLFTKPNHTMSQLIPSCNHRVESHILMMNCRFTTSKSRDSQVGNTCCFCVYNGFT